MKIVICFLLFFTFIGLNVSVADDIYRWRDKNGKVHFGDRPPASIESESVTVKPNVYHSPNIEKMSQGALSNERVVMYSAKWCGYCKKARRYFKSNRISFVEYDVESSAKGNRDYKKLGAGGVPIILVGKHRLNGFSEASFRNIYRDEL
ncbi:MAG: glutaredoxin domain-containing protein [Candidatus Thiodiazotropha sp. (ex. Lucinoma kazani)]